MTTAVEHPLPLFLWLTILSALIVGVGVTMLVDKITASAAKAHKTIAGRPSGGEIRAYLKLDTTEWDRQIARLKAEVDALPPDVRAAAAAATTVDVRPHSPRDRSAFDKHVDDAIGLDS